MDPERPANILLQKIKMEDGAHALTESVAMRSKAVISEKGLNHPSAALSHCIVRNQVSISYVHRT